MAALEALVACAPSGTVVIVELLSWASFPGGAVTTHALDLLARLGLRDKKSIFEEHLEDLRASRQSLPALRRRWQEFLEGWTPKCVHHMHTQAAMASLVERPSSVGPAGAGLARRALGSTASVPSSTIDMARRASSFDSPIVTNPTPVDVVNYFIAVEEERLRMQQSRPRRSARVADPVQPAARPDPRPATTVGRVGYSRAAARPRDAPRDPLLPPLVGRPRAVLELPPRYVSLEEQQQPGPSVHGVTVAIGHLSPHALSGPATSSALFSVRPTSPYMQPTTASASAGSAQQGAISMGGSGAGVSLSLAPTAGGAGEDGFQQVGLRAHNRLFVLAQSWARD
jgi:hypothetical protein